MKEMTTCERMARIFQHKEPDRVPITDWMWESTIARWKREGLPEDAGLNKFLGIDRIIYLSQGHIDTSPRFEKRIIEETDTYIIDQDEWGLTKKNFKPVSATCQHIHSLVKDPDSWLKAKERMVPTRDRVNWEFFKKNYRTWKEEGAWIIMAPWYGFDVTCTRMCGSETILYAMADNPEWVADMFNHGCDLTLKVLDMLWDEGYAFDELFWFDDMAYRNGMMFSKTMWRELVMPYQMKTIEWAHSHGIKAHLHCCGNVTALVPELIDLGIDMLNPMEVKSGMDPAYIKKQFGKELALKGGFDARLWENPQRVEADIRSLLPVLMESGGYLFASDHSIPDNVSLENYQQIVKLVKEVGRY